MKKLMIFLPAVALFAAPAFAQSMSPAAYVKAAGASDLFEQQSAQTVLQSTRNEKVRSFAKMMVTDHTKSTSMVKAAAAKSHVPAGSPKLTAEQAQMLAQLRGEHGSARDATYITQQKAAHAQALAVQQAYASDGTAPALKATAGQIVPVVQHHIEMLNAM